MAAPGLSASGRCCLCGREFSDSAPVGGACLQAGCGAPICRTCYAIRGRPFCPQHSPRPDLTAAPFAPTPTEAPAADTEELWGFLREARAAELNFLARFQANTEREPSLALPDGPPLPVRAWADLRSTADRAPDLRRLLPVPKPVSEVRTLCPVNAAVRYTVRKPPLVVEARCCADLAALVRQPRSAPPLSLDALLKVLHDLEAAARKAGGPLIAGLFSLHGWDDACAAYLVGDAARPALVHPHVSACLIGPAIRQVRANPTDRRLQLYLPLFRGETLDEEAARCKAAMYHELLALDRVFVDPYAREHEFRPDAARLAAQELARELADVELVSIPDVGPSLKWRK
jgi:hypothetical protein